MYAEIQSCDDMSQKTLFFKLNDVFNLDRIDSSKPKIIGIYAIYKDDVCLYVGQSKNIASRLATHLKGKYQNSTNIYIWNIEDIGFHSFKERNTISQKVVLDNCEKFFMAKLQPIENILIDMDFELAEEKIPLLYFSDEYDKEVCSLSIRVHCSSIYIASHDSSTIDNINLSKLFLSHAKETKIIDEHAYEEIKRFIPKTPLMFHEIKNG